MDKTVMNMDKTTTADGTPSQITADRERKVDELRAAGIEPYPHVFLGRESADDLRSAATGLAPGQSDEGPRRRAAGRLVARRDSGAMAFLDLEDRSGTIQLLVALDRMGASAFDAALDLDLGDVIGATGTLIRTRRGEPTLKTDEIVLLAKALAPPADRRGGLSDPDRRRRHRDADLQAHRDVRERFITRARVISAIRSELDSQGFIEVETPTLQPLYGGAAARPFITHHNQLGRDLYLRIAPELYLKRLIVGGLERVYELGKDFRNEGVSSKHNPEFTMVEWYQAYADYRDLAGQLERLVHQLAHVAGHPRPDEFAPPWDWRPLDEAIKELTGIDILAHPEADDLANEMRAAALDVPPYDGWSDLVNDLQGAVEASLTRPTFLVDHPEAMSPLAKGHRSKPGLTERFEAFVGRMEIANAFTELNDPHEQRERFLRTIGEGDLEHPLDEDFLLALMRGMPPTAGIGVGIDRLVMLLTETASIRDVVLFPAMRSKESAQQDS